MALGTIRNLTTGMVLADRARVAASLGWRLRGMIARRFTDFDALVFSPCGGIHTCFMGIPLDVVFLDRGQCVVGTRQGLAPWRLTWEWGARHTVELPGGALQRCPVKPGEYLFLALPDWQNPPALGKL